MTIFGREKQGTLISARDLEERTELPLPMISKILKGLARKNILASQRGVHGGYYLAKTPAELKVGEIIEAIDGPIAITECMDDDCDCRYRGVCPMHNNWSKINLAISQALMKVSLEEMCDWQEPVSSFNMNEEFVRRKAHNAEDIKEESSDAGDKK